MNALAVHALPKVERCGNVMVVTLSGGNIRDVENVLARDLDGLTDGQGAHHLLLDFASVEFVSSVELGTLIGLQKKLKASGGRLNLFNVTPQILEVFAITRLDAMLGICREEAAVV